MSGLTSGLLIAAEFSSISEDDDAPSVDRSMPVSTFSSWAEATEQVSCLGMAPSMGVLRRGGALGVWSTPASMAQQRKRP